MKKSRKKIFSTIFKIGISVFLLYFVFTKISLEEIGQILRKVKIHFVLLSVFFFLLSQWISAKRLLLLFQNVGFNLSVRSNNILYLIAMFYNFFIPGGIGGDAYKIYVLNNKFKWSLKTLSATVFVDRFMGLTAIGILISLLGYNLLATYSLVWLIPLLLICIVVASYLIIKILFKSFLKSFSKSLFLSIGVQLFQVISVLCIIFSLDIEFSDFNYILIFLVSSVLSIFSFSGIGVREYVFYESSVLLDINSSNAVMIGLIFSMITAFISLFGIVFHFRKSDIMLDHEADTNKDQ